MFLEYHPDLLPALAELQAAYAASTKGMPAFPAEHWEALFLRQEVDPRRDVFILARPGPDGNPALTCFAWMHSRAVEGRAFLRGPFMSPRDPECSDMISAIYQKAIERASKLGVDFLEGRSIYEPWVEQLGKAGFVSMGASERWRLFPVKGSVELSPVPPGCAVRGIEGVSDIPALMALFTDAFSSHWDYMPPRREDYEELIRGKHFEPRLALMAVYRGEPVGYAIGQSLSDPSTVLLRAAYLVSIGVRKDFQGRGLGKAVLSSWIRSAYDAGLRAAELDVDSDNSAAKALYAGFGFKWMRTEHIWRYYLKK